MIGHFLDIFLMRHNIEDKQRICAAGSRSIISLISMNVTQMFILPTRYIAATDKYYYDILLSYAILCVSQYSTIVK